MLKTYKDWEGSLGEYLQIGDLVDEEMVDHFTETLPPATHNSRCIQLGEPYSHVGERATYPTLKNTPDGWAYAGNCFFREVEEPK